MTSQETHDRVLAAVDALKDDLVAKVESRNDATMPDGSKADGQWHLMTYEFHLKPGGGMAPKPLGTKTAEPA